MSLSQDGGRVSNNGNFNGENDDEAWDLGGSSILRQPKIHQENCRSRSQGLVFSEVHPNRHLGCDHYRSLE